MTDPSRRIQIALVGFDYDRILKPVKDVPPNKLYLCYDNKRDDYGKISNKFAKQIKKNVSGIINTELVGFNPWDFKDCFEQLMRIFQAEKNAEITVNISSSTNLAVAAAVYAATIYKARIVYVRGAYKELPRVTTNASAARENPQFVDPFTPAELEKDEITILRTLYKNGGEVESLTQLVKTIFIKGKKVDDGILRKNRALLSYKIKKLETLGFVTREFSGSRNRVGVKLTDAGEVMGKIAED